MIFGKVQKKTFGAKKASSFGFGDLTIISLRSHTRGRLAGQINILLRGENHMQSFSFFTLSPFTLPRNSISLSPLIYHQRE